MTLALVRRQQPCTFVTHMYPPTRGLYGSAPTPVPQRDMSRPPFSFFCKMAGYESPIGADSVDLPLATTGAGDTPAVAAVQPGHMVIYAEDDGIC